MESKLGQEGSEEQRQLINPLGISDLDLPMDLENNRDRNNSTARLKEETVARWANFLVCRMVK